MTPERPLFVAALAQRHLAPPKAASARIAPGREAAPGRRRFRSVGRTSAAGPGTGGTFADHPVFFAKKDD